MLAAIIPTLNAEAALPNLLGDLRQGSDVIVVTDGASSDNTVRLAVSAGAALCTGGAGRGAQLRRGASWAELLYAPDWYLFLHADARLPKNWDELCRAHMSAHPDKAAYFKLRLDTKRPTARMVEFLAAQRARFMSLPYGDQGLLISRALYNSVGGYPDWPLFEDVDLVDRLVARYGRQVLTPLPGYILTSAEKYERDGVFVRALSNQRLLWRYRRGETPGQLTKDYS